MYLALDPDEQAIASAAADFLGSAFPLARLHGATRDEPRLGEFAELGWLGLAAPDHVGGSGLGAIEEMLFFLALGREAGPPGVLFQVLAVAAAQQHAELAASLLAAEASVALRVEVSAAGDWRCIGDPSARYLLALGPGGAALFDIDGAERCALPCLDRSVGMYTTAASPHPPVAESGGEVPWLRAQVAVSAMLVGTAERALDMIVGYARQRETFGRPIGAYQAVRHPCADMALRVESARCQLYYAATAFAAGHDDAAQQVDAAKLLAVQAARANTDSNIQLHGGIGVTDEFSAHLLLKRANLLWRLFGGSAQDRASLLRVDGEG